MASCLLAGAYLGVVQQSYSWGGMRSYQQPGSVYKPALRIVLVGVTCLPVLALTKVTLPNAYAMMVIAGIVPYSILGYLIFGICD
jgi:hypothetical protein